MFRMNCALHNDGKALVTFPIYHILYLPLSLLELGVALVHRLAGRPRALIGAQSGDGEDTQEQPSLKSIISRYSLLLEISH